MKKGSRKIIFQSGIVALVISLALPIAWTAVTGYTQKTPTISKQKIQAMTPAERDAWISNNSKRVSFIKHVQSIPYLVENQWPVFLEASADIFIIVFLMNYFILIFLHAKP